MTGNIFPTCNSLKKCLSHTCQGYILGQDKILGLTCIYIFFRYNQPRNQFSSRVKNTDESQHVRVYNSSEHNSVQSFVLSVEYKYVQNVYLLTQSFCDDEFTVQFFFNYYLSAQLLELCCLSQVLDT